MEEARFAQGVRFDDGEMAADLGDGPLCARQGDAGARPAASRRAACRTWSPRSSRSTPPASTSTLAGPEVDAAGDREERAATAEAGAGKPGGGRRLKMPSMLKQDQPVNVTANELAYDGTELARAVFRQRAAVAG